MRYVVWIAVASIVSGCTSGERLRDIAPVVFRDVLGPDADARFVVLGADTCAPAARAESEDLLFVQSAAGTSAPSSSSPITSSSPGAGSSSRSSTTSATSPKAPST